MTLSQSEMNRKLKRSQLELPHGTPGSYTPTAVSVLKPNSGHRFLPQKTVFPLATQSVLTTSQTQGQNPITQTPRCIFPRSERLPFLGLVGKFTVRRKETSSLSQSDGQTAPQPTLRVTFALGFCCSYKQCLSVYEFVQDKCPFSHQQHELTSLKTSQNRCFLPG